MFIFIIWGVISKGYWYTSSNLLANYLYITYREISKYRISITFPSKQLNNYLSPSQKINSTICITLITGTVNTGRTVDILTWTWNIWGGRTEHTSKLREIATFARTCSVQMAFRLFYLLSVVMTMVPMLLR